LAGDEIYDPHDEIVRLEEHIEELAAMIESCRKFILVSRIAVAGGGLVLVARSRTTADNVLRRPRSMT
jgi:glycine cleavage system regulatory protein